MPVQAIAASRMRSAARQARRAVRTWLNARLNQARPFRGRAFVIKDIKACIVRKLEILIFDLIRKND